MEYHFDMVDRPAVKTPGSRRIIVASDTEDRWFRRQQWNPNNGHRYALTGETQKTPRRLSKTNSHWRKRTKTTNARRVHKCTGRRRKLQQHSTHCGNTSVVFQFWREQSLSDTFAYWRPRAKRPATISASHHFTFGPPLNPRWSLRRALNVLHFKTWVLLAKYVD